MRHLSSLSLLIVAVAALPILAPSAVWAADAAKTEKEAMAFPDISKADLDHAIAAKEVTLIDCNGTTSYAAGRIPGAMDFAVVGKDLATHLPKDKSALIVSYCGGPTCGAYKEGADAAKALGYTNVKHFSAGISGWKKAGGALDK